MGSFVPTTPSERQQMLKTIGVGSVEELFRDVPQEMRIDGYLDLPSGKSEMETLDPSPRWRKRTMCSVPVCAAPEATGTISLRRSRRS